MARMWSPPTISMAAPIGSSTRVRERSAGLEFSYVDLRDAAALAAAIRPETRMIWVETPSNPLLKLVDLAAMAALARARGCSPSPTTPSPAPMSSGRWSWASTSSCIRRPNTSTAIPTWSAACSWSATTGSSASGWPSCRTRVGAVAGPFDSFLALRGLKTLALRMERHCANALAIARHLERHPRIARVHYPGLASHPQHELAQRQMHGFGGMVTVVLAGDLADARRFLERVELFALAESLGGVESLIEHPAIMTHASMPPEQRRALGIGDTLVRLSVGIEECDDLIADLDQALDSRA